MRPFTIFAAAMIWAVPAIADTEAAISRHILPAVAEFRGATEALSKSAATDCTAPAVIPAYHAAFDAWMGISHLQFGPLERDGRNLGIAFWPDPRGTVSRSVAQMITERDAAVERADDFAEVSIAGRGLFALEAVLFDHTDANATYRCRYIRALADDLARSGALLETDWATYADAMRHAGADGNAIYQSKREADQALYTALMTGLEFTKDQRLGRPLGTFERPRPTRAEAWRSGRSRRNVTLSLIALRDLARTMAVYPIPMSEAAFAAALKSADIESDPVFAGVDYPGGWLKVEIVQQNVGFTRDALGREIGILLGLAQGFNSADGD